LHIGLYVAVPNTRLASQGLLATYPRESLAKCFTLLKGYAPKIVTSRIRRGCRFSERWLCVRLPLLTRQFYPPTSGLPTRWQSCLRELR